MAGETVKADTSAAPSHARGKHRAASRIAIMTNFIFYANPILTLSRAPWDEPVRFSLEAAADLTGVHPEMLRYYCRVGLLDARHDGLNGQPSFDENALAEVRRIEHYRRHLGISRRALPLICELRREGERLQIDLQFLGEP